jgi:hypothetical protein
MPYLACPNCRLTVYNPPTVAAPTRCPRCGVRLAVTASSLFRSRYGGERGGSELADLLRRRATGRGGRQQRAD